ncbi:YjbH domain-containing protein [Ruegeria arenilitoris]|uniref:YjbH domain-containing protein n=1 Tax=Ruegeria arenilitoris TaxID=1173585 RepID=UPI00147ACF59
MTHKRTGLLALVCALATGLAQAQSVSTYGTPGLIEIPTAEMFDDGELVFTAAGLRNTGRATMTFQLLPWVHGSFRYSVLNDFQGPGATLYDRSFDVHFRLREESRNGPAIVMGLRDFGGTGVYAAEYFVATKTFRDRFKLTGGIGWGRMAGRGAFSNPLGIFGSRFDTRPASNSNGQGGELEFGNWFRGDAALFGGASWQYNDRLTFLAEYSPDLYTQESDGGIFKVKTPINVGAQYRFRNGSQLTASLLYGNSLGLTYSYFVDPRKAVTPGGQGSAPPPLLPRSQVAAATTPADSDAIRTRMQSALNQEGLRLVYLSETGDTVRIGVENNRYGQAAQALGRTARVLANEQPPQAEHFDIALMSNGVPLSAVRVNRDDLYDLEHDPDNTWRSFARAQISDTLPLVQGGVLTDAFPHFSYSFGPYLNFSFFDPDDPLRYEVGVALELDYTVTPGLTFSTGLRQPILSTLDDSTRPSDSTLPRVRSDWNIYARESNLRIEHMTGEYMWRPGENLYARTTLGYLETMFGGLSTELLWYPTNSRLALGAEANYVVQRDFDVLFGFQDYNVFTGHVSAYYDLPGDYHAQVDVGRYLAGDYGATFTLDREFNNGFKVGAFFTLTNVSSEEFGEGSFDKGIRLEIPISWMTGRPSRNKIAQTIRPVLRDGGARLNVRNRLYGVTREARAQDLSRSWARFWR